MDKLGRVDISAPQKLNMLEERFENVYVVVGALQQMDDPPTRSEKNSSNKNTLTHV